MNTTTLGTPSSPKWDPDWLTEVDRVETELGHRICGAHSPAWTPCKLTSTHPNGRCRFHGGAPGIGAPGGNRNAWIHGLYSRRIQQCGDHCPLWTHCPMAGKDVLTLPPPERPHCVYEQDEYESILSVIARSAVATKQSHSPEPSTFSLEKGKVEPKEIDSESKCNSSHESDQSEGSDQSEESDPSESPHQSHTSHTSHSSHPPHDPSLRDSASPREPNLIHQNIALFQVLLTRAQAALGIARLTDETRASSLNNNYRLHTTRIAALVQAQLQIARELRHWLKLLPNDDSWRGHPARGSSTPPPPPPPPAPPAPPKYTGVPMRMLKLLEEVPDFLADALQLQPGETNPFLPRLNKRPPPDPPPFPA